jgi:anthranilate synthase/aminodeoxychorismate synthase-like glutamine amidotransferase
VIAVIDGGDPFGGSLAQYLGMLGGEPEVHRGESVSPERLAARSPAGLVLASGPWSPRGAAAIRETVRALAGQVPILAIGAGHLLLAEAHGGRTGATMRVAPGGTSPVMHRGRGLFAGLDNPFEATRYHPLLVDRASAAAAFEVEAWTPEGEIMGLRHRRHECWGVQFDPSSILTRPGLRLVANFLTLCRQHKGVAQ